MSSYQQDQELLSKVKDKLATDNTSKKVLVGYDGFIDEIIHLVSKRQDDKNYDRINTIKEYGERIIEAAGLSANIEMVPTQIKLGGNGPIMADSLIRQDHKLTYAGSLGKNGIHPVFADFASQCEGIVSFAEPGHTDALEFMDGKLMMGKTEHMVDVNWSNLVAAAGEDKVKEIITNSALISFNNWTMLSGMDSIMDGILEIIKETGVKPTMFIDLADPQKRLDEDILKALHKLTEYGKYTDMVLSLNKNESIIAARLLNVESEDVTERAIKIREALNISHVVIHPLHGAAVATKDWSGYVVGPYTKTPKLTTGAGDNFNAGFCNGILRGFTPEECLAMGVSTSGFYVRNAHAPNKKELVDFLA